MKSVQIIKINRKKRNMLESSFQHKLKINKAKNGS